MLLLTVNESLFCMADALGAEELFLFVHGIVMLEGNETTLN